MIDQEKLSVFTDTIPSKDSIGIIYSCFNFNIN
jgi:hypothetical protein